MTATDSLAIVSLVIGVGAIALAFVFYRWTDTASRETRDAAKDIQKSIEKLETLYDKMFDSTFTAMEDANKAIRDHAFNSLVDKKELQEATKTAIEGVKTGKEDIETASENISKLWKDALIEAYREYLKENDSSMPSRTLSFSDKFEEVDLGDGRKRVRVIQSKPSNTRKKP